MGSPFRSLGPFPSDIGSVRLPDVKNPLVDGSASARPLPLILTGPREEDREDLASDNELVGSLSPLTSPSMSSVS